MQACCCSMAGTAACMRCHQNNLSNWPDIQRRYAPPSNFPLVPQQPLAPAPVIDYDKLADKIVERLRAGQSAQEAVKPADESATGRYRTGY